MNRRRLKAVFFACVVTCFAMPGPAVATDEAYRELLDALRDDGSLSPERHEELIDRLENGAAAVDTRGGIEVESADGEFAFELGGRLAVDLAKYAEDEADLGDGTELRQARFSAEGMVHAGWDYELAVDFAGGDADVKDAYLGYEGPGDLRMQLGQFKEPFSLEEQTSSGAITFMERALVNELAPGRNIGFGVASRGKGWTLAGGVFGEAFDDDADDEGDEGWGMSARATWAPWGGGRKVLHLGAALASRYTDDEHEAGFGTGPESSVTEVEYLDTDDIDDVDRIESYGLEAAVVRGPWSLQAEYLRSVLERRDDLDDLEFDGYYVFASWILTGESRNYRAKTGNFGGVEPHGERGAWELALRFSELDLSDGDVTGGAAEQVTLGLNWYANSNTRFMINYVRVDNDEDADADGDLPGDDDPDILQVRAQLDF